MKLIFKLTLISMMVLSLNGFTKSKVVKSNELNIEELFVVPKGYDDNDNIQFTLNGKLTNSCFDLGETKLKIIKEENKIYISQKIEKRVIADCLNLDMIPSFLNFPVAFTKTISIGRLPSGNWNVEFKLSDEDVIVKSFEIEKSKSKRADNYLYAPITNAFIPDLMFETKNGEVVLTGELPNRCLSFNEKNVEVTRNGNVIVLQPKMDIKRGEFDCPYNPVPLQKIISLGELTQGTYLIHIRTLSGNSINKTFRVQKKNITTMDF